MAAARPGNHSLAQRAPAEELWPAQEPMRPAVVPRTGARAARDRDRGPGAGHLVVELGVRGRHVDAAVADIGKALLADRPVSVVQVVAGPGEAHRPGHLDP